MIRLPNRTKSEVARRLGYKVYDHALPHMWFNKMAHWLKATGQKVDNPSAHYVWVYEDKHGKYVFGLPGPLTSIGRDVLKLVDKMEDKEEPVSPSLSGLHE